jgi:hypothetical protein
VAADAGVPPAIGKDAPVAARRDLRVPGPIESGPTSNLEGDATMATTPPSVGDPQPAPSAPRAREAPAPIPRPGDKDDAAHRPLPDEPVLDVELIQGNILAGFNKDNQMLIFLRLDDAAEFRSWLAAQVPFIASLKEVLAFNRLSKMLRARRSVDTGSLKATWMNIAFSHAGLLKQNGVPSPQGGIDVPSASPAEAADA